MTRHHTSTLRVQKPQSAKQHANARAYVHRGQQEAKIVYGPLKGMGLPQTSWWLGADREGFSTKAREQSDRIRNSRFAAVHDPTYREG